MITATWNPDRAEETKVSFGIGYSVLSRIERLDFLADVLHDVTKKYQSELNKITGEDDGI